MHLLGLVLYFMLRIILISARQTKQTSSSQCPQKNNMLTIENYAVSVEGHRFCQIIYVVCAMLLVAFIGKRALSYLRSNGVEVIEDASNRNKCSSIQSSIVGTNEASSLIRSDTKTDSRGKCKYCSNQRRSNPVPIINVMEQQPSSQDNHATASAEYNLLTWRMYNRIMRSRYNPPQPQPVPKQISLYCEACGVGTTDDLESDESAENGAQGDRVYPFSWDS